MFDEARSPPLGAGKSGEFPVVSDILAVDHIYLQLLPLFQSEDFKEGLSSFAERREPNFKGR